MKKLYIVISIACLLGVSSCKVTRKITSRNLAPMPAEKLLTKVENEAPVYNTYEAKKVTVSYTEDGKKNSFSGNIILNRDKMLALTARKMNIPLGRAYASPDSFILINYIDKNYIRDDIGIINSLFGFDIDYAMLQALITADIRKLIDTNKFDNNLLSTIDEKQYRIDSQYKRKNESKNSEAKNKNPLQQVFDKLNETELINYSAWIDPNLYIINKVKINNSDNNQIITLLYNDYQMIEKSMFPQRITCIIDGPKSKIEVEMKLSRSQINGVNNISVSVPKTYTRSEF